MYEQGNTALRWRPISAFLVSPVGDCGISVGVRSFYSSLLPHLSLLTAMESSPPCSDTSTSSITHSSDALTAPMRVYATMCDSLFLHEFVWAISQLCVSVCACRRFWICVNVCALSFVLTTHTRIQRPFCSSPKMYHSFFSKDVTGQVWKAGGSVWHRGHNVNSQECDPYHSKWFRRGVCRGERSLTALQQKKWNIIPVTIKLKLTFQPIAIVYQLCRRSWQTTASPVVFVGSLYYWETTCTKHGWVWSNQQKLDIKHHSGSVHPVI